MLAVVNSNSVPTSSLLSTNSLITNTRTATTADTIGALSRLLPTSWHSNGINADSPSCLKSYYNKSMSARERKRVLEARFASHVKSRTRQKVQENTTHIIEQERSTKDPKSVLEDLAQNDSNERTTVTKARVVKHVRFASGDDLERIHYTKTMYSLDSEWIQILVLMMNPSQRKFEFLRLEIPRDDNFPTQHILQQLSGLSSDPFLQSQQYTDLVRAKTNTKMMACSSSHLDGLGDGELFIALVEGVSGLLKMAKPLAQNKKILKKVKKTTCHRIIPSTKTSPERPKETTSKNAG